MKFYNKLLLRKHVGLTSTRKNVSDVEDISLMVVIVSGLCKLHSISSLDHIDLEILMICELSYFYPMCE